METSKPETARPPLYSVLLLNDDYTPMDFVVDVLMRFFAMNLEKATQVMLHVHTRGQGVCGVFTRDVAESKVTQVNEFSRSTSTPCCARWKRRKQPARRPSSVSPDQGHWKRYAAFPI